MRPLGPRETSREHDLDEASARPLSTSRSRYFVAPEIEKGVSARAVGLRCDDSQADAQRATRAGNSGDAPPLMTEILHSLSKCITISQFMLFRNPRSSRLRPARAWQQPHDFQPIQAALVD